MLNLFVTLCLVSLVLLAMVGVSGSDSRLFLPRPTSKWRPFLDSGFFIAVLITLLSIPTNSGQKAPFWDLVSSGLSDLDGNATAQTLLFWWIFSIFTLKLATLGALHWDRRTSHFFPSSEQPPLSRIGEISRLFALAVPVAALLAITALISVSFIPEAVTVDRKTGAITIGTKGKKRTVLAVGAAEGWTNSGIKLKKGQTVRISFSGAAHVALHHVLFSATTDRPLKEDWYSSGYSGGPDQYVDLLKPGAPAGALLAQVCCQNTECLPIRDKQFKNTTSQQKSVEHIRSNGFQLVAKCDGDLRFSINDGVPSKREHYVRSINYYSEKYSHSKRLLGSFPELMRRNPHDPVNQDRWLSDWALEGLRYALEFDELVLACTSKDPKDPRDGDTWPDRAPFKIAASKSLARLRTRNDVPKSRLALESMLHGDPGLGILGRHLKKVCLSSKAQKSWFGNPACLGALECISDSIRWEYLATTNYKSLWFDDNIGTFLITVER